MRCDLIVAGGTLVLPQGELPGHVLMHQGRIVGIMSGERRDLPAARQVLDADGLYVLPGLIDAHVHFREPGATHKEDWASGSAAAACGGIATVFEMPNTSPPTTDPERVREKAAIAEGKSYVDFGLFAVIVDSNLDQIEPLRGAGIVGYKIFLGETTGDLPAPDDGGVVDAMGRIAGSGLRLGFHAEDRAICDHFRALVRAAGRNDLAAHTEARPSIAEAGAISRICTLARYTGCPVHIFHLAAGEGVELVQKARAWGVDVTVETCPQYLFLDVNDAAVTSLGGRARTNPPLRDRTHGERLWQGLNDGTIQIIASDHAPHAPADKEKGTVWDVASGLPGVETTLYLLLTEVRAGRIALADVARWLAEGPARAWGVYPRKGALQIGSDADLTLVDLDRSGVITAAGLHGKMRFTPYEGRPYRGAPVYTIVGGRVVAAGGEIVAEPGGRWIRPDRRV